MPIEFFLKNAAFGCYWKIMIWCQYSLSMHSQSFSSMASLGPEKNGFFDYRYAYVMKCLKSRTIFTFSWLVLNVLTLCSHESGHFFHWTIGQTVPKSPMQNTLPLLNAELSYQCHFNHSKSFYHSYMAGLLTHLKCMAMKF